MTNDLVIVNGSITSIEVMPMTKMQKKNCAQPDETRSFDKGRLELVTLGGVTFGRGTFQPVIDRTPIDVGEESLDVFASA